MDDVCPEEGVDARGTVRIAAVGPRQPFRLQAAITHLPELKRTRDVQRLRVVVASKRVDLARGIVVAHVEHRRCSFGERDEEVCGPRVRDARGSDTSELGHPRESVVPVDRDAVWPCNDRRSARGERRWSAIADVPKAHVRRVGSGHPVRGVGETAARACRRHERNRLHDRRPEGASPRRHASVERGSCDGAVDRGGASVDGGEDPCVHLGSRATDVHRGRCVQIVGGGVLLIRGRCIESTVEQAAEPVQPTDPAVEAEIERIAGKFHVDAAGQRRREQHHEQDDLETEHEFSHVILRCPFG